jgi:hypothetical protein
MAFPDPWLRLKAGLRRLLAGAFLLGLGFLAPASHAASIQLAWDANGEPDVAGYRVYFGTAANSYPNSVDAGPATEAELDGLVPGVFYYLSVTAYSSSGVESSFAEPITYRVPAAPSRSRYVGLIGEGGARIQASFLINISAKGKASGRLKLDGKQYAWKGTFSPDGALVVVIPRKGGLGNLILSLEITNNGEALTGTLSDGAESSDVSGKRATNRTAATKSPHRGRYTAFLSPPDPQNDGGYGYAAVQVSAKGFLRMVAALPDGRTRSYGGLIDDAGSVPMHAFLPGGKGFLYGRIQFRDVANGSDADAEITWVDGMQTVTAIDFRAARYTPQPAQAYLSGADISISPESTAVVAGAFSASAPNTLVAVASGGEPIKLKVTMPNGLFAGSYVALDGTTHPFKGTVYLKGVTRGYGRLLNKANPGGVEMAAPSAP